MNIRYTLPEYDTLCVFLDKGAYTLKDLEEIIDIMKHQNQRVADVAKDALSRMNKAADDNGEPL